MDEGGWIIVPSWDKFQHYTDRNPPWIKLYTEVNSRPEWLELSLSARGLLVTCWTEYARSLGVLPVARLRGLVASDADAKYVRRHLERLSHAGFIQISASRPLALARSREAEKRREEGPPLAKPEEPKISETTNRDFTRVGQMIRNGVIRDNVDLAAEIAGYQLPPELAESLRDQLAARLQ